MKHTKRSRLRRLLPRSPYRLPFAGIAWWGGVLFFASSIGLLAVFAILVDWTYAIIALYTLCGALCWSIARRAQERADARVAGGIMIDLAQTVERMTVADLAAGGLFASSIFTLIPVVITSEPIDEGEGSEIEPKEDGK